MPKKRTATEPRAPQKGQGAVSFINISHPGEMRNPTTQTDIRRAVMRDIGKARRRRPQNPTVAIDVVHVHADDRGDHLEPAEVEPTYSLVPRGSYPVEVGRRELELVRFIVIEKDYVFRPFRDPWIRLGLQDASAFYLTLASSSLFMDHHRTGQPVNHNLAGTPEAARYSSEAMKQLVPRLSSRSKSADAGIISVILGLVCHTTKLGDWQGWQVHMAGLERISKLRGGFADLTNDLTLMAAWLDLLGAVYYGTRPRFPLSNEFKSSTLERAHQDYSADRDKPHLLPQATNRLLRGILQEMAQVAVAVNLGGRRADFWREDVTAAKLVIPLTHFLLCLPRLPDGSSTEPIPQTGVLAEMVRVSCLVLLAGTKQCFLMDAPELDMLRGLFDGVLRHFRPDGQDEEAKMMAMWALVTVTLTCRDERPEVVGTIVGVMQSMELEVEAALGAVRSLAWVESVEAAGVQPLREAISAFNIAEHASVLPCSPEKTHEKENEMDPRTSEQLA